MLKYASGIGHPYKESEYHVYWTDTEDIEWWNSLNQREIFTSFETYSKKHNPYFLILKPEPISSDLNALSALREQYMNFTNCKGFW